MRRSRERLFLDTGGVVIAVEDTLGMVRDSWIFILRSNFEILTSRAKQRKKSGPRLGPATLVRKLKSHRGQGWERGESPVERCQAPIMLGPRGAKWSKRNWLRALCWRWWRGAAWPR